MKLQLNDFIRRAAILICGTALLACNNLDELEQRVDSLESRIQALETQLPALNENVTALSEILESGNISSVNIDEKTGEVTITTTGGNTYTFTQGSVGNAPKLSVDDEGYWIVSYDNWETEERILDQDGNPVPATSSSIVFGVSDDGYWEISYDGGETFVPVYKEDGTTRIPALEEDSDFFKSIVYDEENQTLTLTLSNDKEIVINVVSDFLCQIQNVTYGEAETFSAGETRDFTVTMRGVATAEVTVPSGWKATLSDVADETATLSVTAPADGTSALTKITADTKSDVTITAVSEKGLTAMAKMTVALSDAPAVSISAGEATSSTLTFTVAPNSHVTSFKYLLYDQDTAAPTNEAAFESATEVTTNLTDPITLDRTSGASEANLTALTTYVLYVLPVQSADGSTTYGSIRSYNATTADYSTYYERYKAGLDITIAGITYNKTTHSNAQLVKASETPNLHSLINNQSNATILFLQDDGDGFTIGSNVSLAAEFILVGNEIDRHTPISATSYIMLRGGSWAMQNIDYDATGISSSYVFTNSGASTDCAKIHIDNCNIKYNQQQFITAGAATSYAINSLICVNSDIEATYSGETRFFQAGSTAVPFKFTEIVFDDNIFYSTGTSTTAQIFNYGNNESKDNLYSWTGTDISVSNNIIYNLRASNPYIKYYTVNSITFNKNVIYSESGNGTLYALYKTDEVISDFSSVTDNILYAISGSWSIAHSNSASGTKPSPNTMTSLESTPFSVAEPASGTFTLSAEYSDYGPQRD